MIDSSFNQKSVAEVLPQTIQKEFIRTLAEYGNVLNELRLRVGRPAVAMLSEGFRTICPNTPISAEMINEAFEKICRYSVYSHQNELSRGYITLPGGHRVGVCGEAATDKNGLRTIKYISSVNIRMASQHIGCAEEVFRALYTDRICGTLIAGPPCSGKTTLLRDIALKLSSPPSCKKAVLIDERNELAAMYRGIPQNTLGEFCDVLTAYPKGEGILNAVRTMSPDVIVCDELGDKSDISAVCDVINTGIVMISSVHACNVDELYKRNATKLLLNSGAFEKIVLLKGGDSRCEMESISEVR